MLSWAAIKRLFVVDLDTPVDPFSLGQWEIPQDESMEPQPTQFQELPAESADDQQGQPITASLEQNLKLLRTAFGLPQAKGLVIHEIELATTPPRRAAVLYMGGMVDTKWLSDSMLGPLLTEDASRSVASPAELFARVIKQGDGSLRRDLISLANDVSSGFAALLVDGESRAITVHLEGWPKRAVERPQMEVTVRGPQEAFSDDLRTNIALVRKRLRSRQCVVEVGRVGRISRSDMAIVYLKGITNPRLVAEVRRRLSNIQVDYVTDVSTLGTFIEDRPWSIYPCYLNTERPDRVAAQVADGFVAILIDNDSHGLVVPTTIITLLQSGEDYYVRWPGGTFMRLTRVAAYYVALLLPAFYIALINYRQEMVPTSLLLAIAQARERVPFSAIVEVLIMEASFELIHEAALRVPTVIGPTIGIVGSLILGQAAVQAGIISPILVIITAVTALAAFAIPTYELQFAVRIWRFAYIGAAAVFGLTGIIILHTANQVYLTAMNAFGTPYVSPVSPPRKSDDSLIRYPPIVDEQRPAFVRAKGPTKQAQVTRPWAPDRPNPKEHEEHDS